MAITNDELARRQVARALSLNTERVAVEDQDPDDIDGDPAKFRIKAPTKISSRSLGSVGLTNTSMVEIFRADLRSLMPLIDAEISSVKLSPGSEIGRIRDFCTAALDLKQN